MAWTSLLLLLSPAFQGKDDLASLRRLLKQAALSREDEPLLKDLADRVSRSRDALSRDKSEAARALHRLLDDAGFAKF
jgi:hypothetical protein